MRRLQDVRPQRDVDLPSLPRAGECSGRNVIATIGINRYVHWARLMNAVSDAHTAAALFTWLGFEQVTKPLFDDRATGKAMQELVTDDLKRTLRMSDSLVLFYAGHATARTHTLGSKTIKTGYLIPVEGSQNAATWIELDGWLRAISLLPARHILVIIDACHSGIALGPVIKWRDGALPQDTPLPILNTRRSRRIITSALDDQVALDSGPVHGHSLFTGCLIEGLAYGLERVGRSLTTGLELALYLQQRVKTYPNSQQTPDFGTFNFDERGELLIPLTPEEFGHSATFVEPALQLDRESELLDGYIKNAGNISIPNQATAIPALPPAPPAPPATAISSSTVVIADTRDAQKDSRIERSTGFFDTLRIKSDAVHITQTNSVSDNGSIHAEGRPCADPVTKILRSSQVHEGDSRTLGCLSEVSSHVRDVPSGLASTPESIRSSWFYLIWMEVRNRFVGWAGKSGNGGIALIIISVSVTAIWPLVRAVRGWDREFEEHDAQPRSPQQDAAGSDARITSSRSTPPADIEVARAKLIALLKGRTDAGCRVLSEPTEASGEGAWSFTFKGSGGCIAHAFVSTASTDRLQLTLTSPLGEKLPVPPPSAEVELFHCPRVAGKYNLVAKPTTPAPYLLASLDCDGPAIARHGPSSAVAEAAGTRLAVRMRKRLDAGCTIVRALGPSMGTDLWNMHVRGTNHCIEHLVESSTQDNLVGVTVTGPDGHTLPAPASATSLTVRYCPARPGDYEHRTLPRSDAPYARAVLECPKDR